MKILLKNGLVYDGNVSKPQNLDILIEDDKIIEMNENIKGDYDKVIDCTNLIVAPGFIDAHSHNDFFYDYDNSIDYFKPFIMQGITTQITGNCGFSVFGTDEDSNFKNDIGGNLFKALNPGSFKSFVKNAENMLHVNIVPLVGHGTIRTSVNGLKNGKLSKEQITEEKKLIIEAMENGAFGGSFGFMYEPGMYSDKEELLEFAKVIAKYDGILTVHPRANSKVALGYPLISRSHLILALEEVFDIMKETKVRTEYSHLIFVGKKSWKSLNPMLKKFHEMKDLGHEIGYDMYSYPFGASVITVVLPSWYMGLSEIDKKKKFNRFKLKLIINITKKLLGIDFCDMRVAYIGDEYMHYEGKTVLEIAKEEKIKPFDMYLKLVDISKGKGQIYLDKYYNECIIKTLMNDDLSIFMTDAWYEEHGLQNTTAYQGFINFLIKGQKYDIPFEKVINKMTKKTAERFKIDKRGEIKVGNYADITIFDPNNLVINNSIPDFTPKGIKYVFINGILTLDDSNFICSKPGKVILKKVL